MMRITLVLLLLSAIVGCAAEYPRVDAAFGKSQSTLFQAQTYDPQAAAHPPAFAPAVSDGQRLANVLAEHRKDVPQGSKQVAQTAQFDVGNGGQ